MDQLKPPEKLLFEGNLAEKWRKWKQGFELYCIASGADKKSEKLQAALLLHVIGEEAREVYNTFHFDDEADRHKLQILLSKSRYILTAMPYQVNAFIQIIVTLNQVN